MATESGESGSAARAGGLVEGRPQLILLVALAAAAAGAWAYTWWMGQSMSSSMLVTGILSGDPAMILLFLSLWLVMMVAMMFPAAAPMVQAYVHLSSPAAAASPWRTTRTFIFVGTYLAVWVATGLLALTGYFLLSRSVPGLAASGTLGPLGAGVVILVAGVYQTTPLKQACLRACRSPFTFLSTNWRPGLRGAIRLGLSHAAYCVGCCWLLFVILFAVGIMAIPWMALLALLIFAEKILPGKLGWGASWGIGGAMAVIGIAFIILPGFGRWALGIT